MGSNHPIPSATIHLYLDDGAADRLQEFDLDAQLLQIRHALDPDATMQLDFYDGHLRTARVTANASPR